MVRQAFRPHSGFWPFTPTAMQSHVLHQRSGLTTFTGASVGQREPRWGWGLVLSRDMRANGGHES